MISISGALSLSITGEKVMQSPIAWFEIAVLDLDRAIAFYQAVLTVTFQRERMGGGDMAVFPHPERGPGGALVALPHLEPRDNGALIYLNAGDDLSPALARVADAGGKVIMAKTDLGNNIGHIALFLDSEGNRVGLYSPH